MLGTPNAVEYRACQLGEEAVDEIEPRSVRRCDGQGEAANRLIDEPGCGITRDMGGVIVEDDLDCGVAFLGFRQLNVQSAALTAREAPSRLMHDKPRSARADPG